jgi:glycosyltransferase involved in cell wall biosynthesis
MSTNEPLVSVVTPVYNGAEFLEACIESVLAQTYQNHEHIIVNDCSKDRSLEIAQSYACKDSRILSTRESRATLPAGRRKTRPARGGSLRSPWW